MDAEFNNIRKKQNKRYQDIIDELRTLKNNLACFNIF